MTTPKVPDDPASDEEEEFVRNKDGKIISSQGNFDIALRRLGVRLSYDDLAKHEIIEGLAGYGPRLDKHARNCLRLAIDARFGFLLSKRLFSDLISDRARLRRVHSRAPRSR